MRLIVWFRRRRLRRLRRYARATQAVEIARLEKLSLDLRTLVEKLTAKLRVSETEMQELYKCLARNVKRVEAETAVAVKTYTQLTESVKPQPR